MVYRCENSTSGRIGNALRLLYKHDLRSEIFISTIANPHTYIYIYVYMYIIEDSFKHYMHPIAIDLV